MVLPCYFFPRPESLSSSPVHSTIHSNLAFCLKYAPGSSLGEVTSDQLSLVCLAILKAQMQTFFKISHLCLRSDPHLTLSAHDPILHLDVCLNFPLFLLLYFVIFTLPPLLSPFLSYLLGKH